MAEIHYSFSLPRTLSSRSAPAPSLLHRRQRADMATPTHFFVSHLDPGRPREISPTPMAPASSCSSHHHPVEPAATTSGGHVDESGGRAGGRHVHQLPPPRPRSGRPRLPRLGLFSHSKPRLGEHLLYFLLSSLRGPAESTKGLRQGVANLRFRPVQGVRQDRTRDH